MTFSDEELQRLHEILVMMMNEIKRVCDENDIKYFLLFGTLLGAIRHKGFIPWDDDFDIGMLREDYEKFMQIADKCFNGKMFVQNYENSKGYGLSFGKVMLNGTTYIENFSKNTDCSKCVYIDVFPIDKVENDMSVLRKCLNKSRKYTKLLLLNSKYNFSGSGLKKMIYKGLYLYAGLLKKDSIIAKFEKNALKYRYSEKYIYTVYSSGNYGKRSFYINPEEIEKLTEAEFDGYSYTIPAGYKEILSRDFGDYMKLPPVEQQKPTHGIIEYSFGEYKEKNF